MKRRIRRRPGQAQAVLGSAPPRYLTVAEARASGFSHRAVYRAIERGELTASAVCSRLRIHPDDFSAWMEGDLLSVTLSEHLGASRRHCR